MDFLFNQELATKFREKRIAREAEARGEARGEAKGEAKGIAKNQKDVATKMIRMAEFSMVQISQISGLTLTQLNKLKAELQ